MPFVDFDELTRKQQAQALALHPKWQIEEIHRFAFWVRPNGAVSRRGGHHQLTQRAGAELDATLREERTLSKDMGAHFKSADFHMAPEKDPSDG